MENERSIFCENKTISLENEDIKIKNRKCFTKSFIKKFFYHKKTHFLLNYATL